jgi:hypothetical protein
MRNRARTNKAPGRSKDPWQLPPLQLQPPGLELLHSHGDWRRDWTHIVPGKFSASPYSGLLFYEQSTGVAEFYATDGHGGISLLLHHEGWRQSWTHIVPGFFGPSGFSGLLLYDQAAGFGAFYDTDGHGDIVLLQEHDDWRTSWTMIVPGRFTEATTTGLLFYEQASGYAESYTTDGAGGIAPLAQHFDWRTSWTQIIAGEFIDTAGWDVPPIDDLFFYEGSTGYCETYQSDGQGGIALHASEAELPPATHIVPGSFGGSGATNLLFYDRATGTATFRDLPYGNWVPLDAYVWPEAWDTIVAGNFWMADPEDRLFADGAFTDLLLYAQALGRGDFYLHEPPDPTPIQPFAGYVAGRSNLPGATIDFHVSSQVGRYAIGIHRLGLHDAPMGQVEDLPLAPTPLPIGRNAYRAGAGWPLAGSFAIPESWPSGLYVGRVATPSIVVGGGELPTAYARRAAAPAITRPGFPFPAASRDIPFVVRAPAGRRARILFAIADDTYEAYNFWGGRSVYGYGNRGQHTWVYPSSSPYHAPYGLKVSFLRGTAGNYADYGMKWQRWELPFLRWLDRQSIKVDQCTESDLHLVPGLLDGYRLLVIVGHSEYWSGPMRDQVEGFVRSGGNVAFFAGNVCWWQVRFEDDGQTMVCYKQKELDPASHSPFTLASTTVNWLEPYLHRPEMLLTGVRYGGNPAPEDRLEFTVENAGHWVFANTGLRNGNGFGLYDNFTISVVGNETDRQQPDSPANFQRLAFVNDADGNEIATMGMFSPIDGFAEDRGIVFTAPTIDWTLGLSQDGGWNPMDLITRNVLIRLG